MIDLKKYMSYTTMASARQISNLKPSWYWKGASVAVNEHVVKVAGFKILITTAMSLRKLYNWWKLRESGNVTWKLNGTGVLHIKKFWQISVYLLFRLLRIGSIFLFSNKRNSRLSTKNKNKNKKKKNTKNFETRFRRLLFLYRYFFSQIK